MLDQLLQELDLGSSDLTSGEVQRRLAVSCPPARWGLSRLSGPGPR
jgi:hypothetical protein